jgi:hypothetical protein
MEGEKTAGKCRACQQQTYTKKVEDHVNGKYIKVYDMKMIFLNTKPAGTQRMR